MKKVMFGLALTVALTGCQGQLPLGASGPVLGANGASPVRLGSLEFKPVSAETAAQLAQRNQTATRMAAPMSAESSAGVAADAKIAPAAMPAPYYYGSYFGGPFGQMKLDSVTEAQAPGAKGTWSELQSQVIAPVVAEWAPDARLVQTNGTLDSEGRLIEGTEQYPGELSWNATYASAGRSEVLEFHVSAKETRVVKLRWSPVDMDLASLKIDAAAATKALAAAVADENAKSKEDELGHDYFMGEGGGTVGIAVPMAGAADVAVSAPAIAVGEPAPGTAPDMPKEDPVYELSPGGRWNVNLAAIGDHLVWELNYSPKPEDMAKPRQAGETFVDGYAYGMVDARTGDLIRLRRPMRITIPDNVVSPSNPEPKPAAGLF